MRVYLLINCRHRIAVKVHFGQDSYASIPGSNPTSSLNCVDVCASYFFCLVWHPFLDLELRRIDVV